VSDPLLATEHSRRAWLRYLETGDPIHEILADAIWDAEKRGVEAALASLGNTTVAHDAAWLKDWLVLHDDKIDLEAFHDRVKEKLGRG
jgi:hypothetical protein